jgi:RHS repeat-associated protein
MYDPFGQTINSTTFASSGTPANTISGGMGWAAAPERKAEIMFSIPIVQMGARVYLPTLGRFLQIDPIQGGTESAYAYANDPINSSDYSGTKLWGWIATIVAVVVVVAVVACFVTGACEVGAGLVAVGTAIVEAVSTVAVVVRTFGSSISASASRAAGPVVNAGSRVVTSANKFLSSASRPATSVASKVPKIPGTYQFRTTSGEMYSGMSTRSISARISAHMADGKLGPDTVVTYWDRSGASKLDIRIAEQRLINGTGGVGNPDVANKINSIRQSYWDELGL